MKVSIGKTNPLADLHFVGTVCRIEDASCACDYELLYDYGDIIVPVNDGTFVSLVSCLLEFEGKRVEVLINVLEESE